PHRWRDQIERDVVLLGAQGRRAGVDDVDREVVGGERRRHCTGKEERENREARAPSPRRGEGRGEGVPARVFVCWFRNPLTRRPAAADLSPPGRGEDPDFASLLRATTAPH